MKCTIFKVIQKDDLLTFTDLVEWCDEAGIPVWDYTQKADDGTYQLAVITNTKYSKYNMPTRFKGKVEVKWAHVH